MADFERIESLREDLVKLFLKCSFIGPYFNEPKNKSKPPSIGSSAELPIDLLSEILTFAQMSDKCLFIRHGV